MVGLMPPTFAPVAVVATFTKAQGACSWGEYKSFDCKGESWCKLPSPSNAPDWAYFSKAPSPSSQTACYNACLANTSCTGFEIANDNSYCAFWFNNACGGLTSTGWKSSNTVVTFFKNVGGATAHASAVFPPASIVVDGRCCFTQTAVVVLRFRVCSHISAISAPRAVQGRAQ